MKTGKLMILKPINMGAKEGNDIFDFVDKKYLQLKGSGNAYIKKGLVVEGREAPNGWLEISFDDGQSSCDVAFDTKTDYDNYFQKL